MKYVEIVAAEGSAETIRALAEKVKADDFRLGPVAEDGLQQMRLLIADERVQDVLDKLQSLLGAQPSARVLVMPIEVSLPKPAKTEEVESAAASTAREALFAQVSKGAQAGSHFLLLVVLSTLVAAIGLIENNVAVLIGAMVIAPLLGPNLAFSLGTALADFALMKRAAMTLLQGVLLAMLLSALLGWMWPSPLHSDELLARTIAGWDTVVLALASGAAAALSLTTGLSSVLVGVMVAVALLPPAAAVGLMLGQGDPERALGALLLLAINVVCVNLSSKLVFLVRGISPRTWLEKEKARRALRSYLLIWVITLAALMLIVLTRGGALA